MVIYVREDQPQESFVECDQDIAEHIRRCADERRTALSRGITRSATSLITVCTEDRFRRNARDAAIDFWRSNAKLLLIN
jgi:hypothetical protein